MRTTPDFWSRVRRDRRGAVAVEYAMILVTVAIPAIVGITAGGVGMLQQYRTGRAAMLDPKP